MPNIKLKNRTYYSAFGRNNQLPEELAFLKGIRPRFFAINRILDKETGSEYFGVEYSVRSAKAMLSALENHNDSGVPSGDLKKTISITADIVDFIHKFNVRNMGMGVPGINLWRRGRNSVTPREAFNSACGVDILKCVKFISEKLSITFDHLTKTLDDFQKTLEFRDVEIEELLEEVRKLKVAPIESKAEIRYLDEIKKLNEGAQRLKAEAYERKFALDERNKIIKDLNEDLERQEKEHREEINRLYNQIDLLKEKL